jgi:hypothetical protein
VGVASVSVAVTVTMDGTSLSGTVGLDPVVNSVPVKGLVGAVEVSVVAGLVGVEPVPPVVAGLVGVEPVPPVGLVGIEPVMSLVAGLVGMEPVPPVGVEPVLSVVTGLVGMELVPPAGLVGVEPVLSVVGGREPGWGVESVVWGLVGAEPVPGVVGVEPVPKDGLVGTAGAVVVGLAVTRQVE